MSEFLKKYKNGIIIIAAVAAVLTAAFFLGDNFPPSNYSSNTSSDVSETVSSVVKEETSVSENNSETTKNISQSSKNNSKSDEPFQKSSQELSQKSDIESSIISEQSSKIKQSSRESSTESKAESSQNYIITSNPEVSAEEKPESSVSKIEISEEISQDNEKQRCTISISCATIFSNTDKLDKSKVGIIPPDGVILQETGTEYSDGESAFDVLKRICTEQKIHLEFSKTPLYNSVYIEGINNLYEFDCGSMSGWMYRVNGKYYNYSCSEYDVNDGDKIEFLYTCDLGKDIGKNFNE